MRTRTVGSLAKKLRQTEIICKGNVMKIVKIDKKTWQIAVICQIFQCFFFTVNVFHCTVAMYRIAQNFNGKKI